MALLCLAFQPALAQAPTRESLRAAEARAQAERQAADLSREAREAAQAAEEDAAEQRVKAAQAAAEAQQALEAATERVVAAEAARAAAEDEAKRRADALAPLLPVMRRLSLWPAETLLALPAPPEDALRGTLVLRSLGRKLQREGEALREAEAKAEALRAQADAERGRLADARASASRAVALLEQELAEARARRQQARAGEVEANRRAEAAISRAGDLKEALDRLERAQARAAAEARRRELAEARRRQEEEARRRDSQAQAQAQAERTPQPEPVIAQPRVTREGRAAPVAGRILRDWGDDTSAGPSRGLTYAALPGARVVSPCTGRTAFAGTFRSYGQLLIVDCGGGYHFVLAGLDRLDASTGQRVLAGEPVGLLDGDGSGKATLYVELRRNGQPVDPKGWYGGRS
ncbi:peptidoglycan DD-metalloendopeptidase family protein [Acetobacteraceae bacterium H6797]|nr:peptidoglycan DD-metalloendopeptidase family protein [Acetobacteraceae bacterium H6797]